MPARAGRVAHFLDRPPWWARAAPKGLFSRLRLFWLLATDFVSGRYSPASWRALATLAAAAAYVLALAFNLARRELRRYCEWKGLSPAHFGLAEPSPPAPRTS